MTEVYLLLYEAVLQTFIQYNKFLQRENSLILHINEQIRFFLASKFVPVETITAAIET